MILNEFRVLAMAAMTCFLVVANASGPVKPTGLPEPASSGATPAAGPMKLDLAD